MLLNFLISDYIKKSDVSIDIKKKKYFYGYKKK